MSTSARPPLPAPTSASDHWTSHLLFALLVVLIVLVFLLFVPEVASLRVR